MFRKLTVILCLISFAPSAVCAQGLTAFAAPQAAVTPAATEKSVPSTGGVNLLLPVERSSAVLLASAEPLQGAAPASCPEQKRESRSAHSWDNFVDVHFGEYRWVWWAGAAAVLIGIHAGH